jgi:hypothetical protein
MKKQKQKKIKHSEHFTTQQRRKGNITSPVFVLFFGKKFLKCLLISGESCVIRRRSRLIMLTKFQFNLKLRRLNRKRSVSDCRVCEHNLDPIESKMYEVSKTEKKKKH